MVEFESEPGEKISSGMVSGKQNHSWLFKSIALVANTAMYGSITHMQTNTFSTDP